MKGFLSFVRKEFRHIFRDKRTILIVLVMPVVQIILFGFAISTEVYDARVDIVGNWSDPSVRRIAGRIEQNHYLRVVSVYETVADVPERFRKGLTDVAVCFERDFDARLRHEGRAEVRLLSDASDPNTAQMIVNYVNGVLTDAQSDLLLKDRPEPASEASFCRKYGNPEHQSGGCGRKPYGSLIRTDSDLYRIGIFQSGGGQFQSRAGYGSDGP